MPFRRVLAACLASLAISATAAGVPPLETIAVGAGPAHAAVDPVSGKVFIAQRGPGRAGAEMSVGVLDADRRVVHLPSIAIPQQVTVSAAWRKAIVTHAPPGEYATVIDIETLATRIVPTGVNAVRTIVVEHTGTAYVLGRGATSGSITAIDLRTLQARTSEIAAFVPWSAAANAAGTRLYVIGTRDDGTGAWTAGFVQAFDTAANAMVGVPTPVGTMPREVIASPEGHEVYVLSHDDTGQALHVLAGEALAPQRTIELPGTAGSDPAGTPFEGAAALDAASNTVYVMERFRKRLSVVSPSSGHVRTVAFESPGYALGVDGVTRRVIVTLDGAGQAAIFSLAGERLDTLPIGRPPAKDEPVVESHVAVDPVSGRAYVTHGRDGSITRLPGAADGAEAAMFTLTDLWHDPAQPGSGVFLDQQGATVFATLFTHDASGQPAWLVMSNGARMPDGSFEGALYRPSGPTEGKPVRVEPVGLMRIVPTSRDTARLAYSIGAQIHAATLRRFRFNDAPRHCEWALGASKAPLERANFTALWSNPAEPGWGLAVSHQGSTVFGVLFAYEADGRPSWTVMSEGVQQARGIFSGELFRASGRKLAVAGSMSLAFAGAEKGVLRYQVDGVDFQTPIIRQSFAPLTTRCSS